GVSFRPLGRSGLIAASWFVVRHARRIDVLSLYFVSRQSLVLGFVFKTLHPHGRLFIKSDWSTEQAKAIRTRGLRARLRGVALGGLPRSAALATAESDAARVSLEATMPALAGRVVIVPNGIDDSGFAAPFPPARRLERKEHLAVAVGRIGAPEKNHDVLLA